MSDVINFAVPSGDGKTRPKFQFDYGQRLLIVGLDGDYTVEFCNEGDEQTEEVYPNSDGVRIPDRFFQSGRNIVGYIVEATERSRNTVYSFTIPIEKRASIKREANT